MRNAPSHAPAAKLRLALLAVILLAEASLTATAQEDSDVNAFSLPGHVEAQPGETVSFQVFIENYGDVPRDVHVSHAWPEGAAPVAENVTMQDARRFLQPDEHAFVNVTMDVLPGAPAGFHVMRILANDPGTGRPYHSTALHIRIGAALEPVDALPHMEPRSLVVDAVRGETRWENIRVSNPGDAERLVDLAANVTGGWEVQVPAPFTLAPGEARVVQVGLHAREDAARGTQGHLRLSADGNSADQIQMFLRLADGAPPRALEVSPATLEVPWNGTAEATVLVQDGGGSGAVRLRIPRVASAPGLEVDLAQAEVRLEPGVAARTTLVARHSGEPVGVTSYLVEAEFDDGGRFATQVAVRVQRPPAGATQGPEPVEQGLATDAPTGPRPIVAGLAAGAAVAGAAALGVAAAHRRWPLAFAALYAKLRPSRILEQPVRSGLVALVRAHPGITMAEAQRRLGLSNGQVAHHVRRLERAGILVSARDGKARRLSPVERGPPRPTPSLADRVVARLAERGPQRVRDLADALGASRQLVHHHLRRLHDEGRVRVDVEAGRLVVSLTPAPTDERAPLGSREDVPAAR